MTTWQATSHYTHVWMVDGAVQSVITATWRLTVWHTNVWTGNGAVRHVIRTTWQPALLCCWSKTTAQATGQQALKSKDRRTDGSWRGIYRTRYSTYAVRSFEPWKTTDLHEKTVSADFDSRVYVYKTVWSMSVIIHQSEYIQKDKNWNNKTRKRNLSVTASFRQTPKFRFDHIDPRRPCLGLYTSSSLYRVGQKCEPPNALAYT